MKVLGIYGSPRKGGNSDQLLDKALEGARSAGAETSTVYARDLKMVGCLECGGCNHTGECVVEDDMQAIYPLLEEAEVIFLASPIFFYGVTAQVKALIDRTQALWSKKRLENPNLIIEIVPYCCDTCAFCPCNIEGRCELYDFREGANRIDLEVLNRLGLKVGDEITSGELMRLIKEKYLAMPSMCVWGCGVTDSGCPEGLEKIKSMEL